MYSVINVKEYQNGLETAVKYIHSKWGNEQNYEFYYDAILHSSMTEQGLPRFYLLLHENAIIGCYALLINDIISRQDLYPWFACFYIEKEHRGNKLGSLLIKHAEDECLRIGHDTMYLATTHEDMYEHWGFSRIEDGFEPTGGRFRIYRKKL